MNASERGCAARSGSANGGSSAVSFLDLRFARRLWRLRLVGDKFLIQLSLAVTEYLVLKLRFELEGGN